MTTVDAVVANALEQFDRVAADLERKSMTDVLALADRGYVIEWDTVDAHFAASRRHVASERVRLADVVRRAVEARAVADRQLETEP